MHLQFALLADFVTIEQRGKLVIAGEFDRYWSQQFPAQLPRFFLVARIDATVAEGKDHSIRIDLFDQDGRRVLNNPPDLQVQFQERGPGRGLRFQLISELNGLPIPRPGEYEFHIVVDGRDVGSAPLAVVQAPQGK